LSSNVSVSNGNLNLLLTSNSGGLVSTDPDDGQPGHAGFQFAYGFAEARIYLPAYGNQIANWPAWWTDSQNWPVTGEMDMMEGLSGSACYHFHYGTSPSDNNGPGGCASGDYSGWHTYGAEWSPGSVTYYYDGKEVGQLTTGITSAPMYLVLENSSSGSYGGSVVTPSTMEVDYTRVWQ
jgi:beta-glucanase (GH16 family)